jgi:hypothetical protein
MLAINPCIVCIAAALYMYVYAFMVFLKPMEVMFLSYFCDGTEVRICKKLMSMLDKTVWHIRN